MLCFPLCTFCAVLPYPPLPTSACSLTPSGHTSPFPHQPPVLSVPTFASYLCRIVLHHMRCHITFGLLVKPCSMVGKEVPVVASWQESCEDNPFPFEPCPAGWWVGFALHRNFGDCKIIES